MPRRPRHLDLISHAKSPLLNDSSPSSPRSPLHPLRPRHTAPSLALSRSPLFPVVQHPRRRLRTLLPSRPPAPDVPQLPQTQPAIPIPWVWYCHMCGRRYDLGVTRRCLEDGHYFCSRPPSQPRVETAGTGVLDGSSSENSSDATTSVDEDAGSSAAQKIIERRKRDKEQRRAKRKRQRSHRGCKTEFDYLGWSAFNEWRREVVARRKAQRKKIKDSRVDKLKGILKGRDLRSKQNQQTQGAKEKENSCWHDCDFPSECHHIKLHEREWLRRRRQEERRAAMEVKEQQSTLTRSNQHLVEDHISKENIPRMSQPPLDQNANINGVAIERTHQPRSLQTKELTTRHHLLEVQRQLSSLPEMSLPIPPLLSPTIPNTNISSSSTAPQNDGPIGVDCDGLGEASYQSSYVAARKKSHAEAGSGGSSSSSSAQGGTTSPGSPLKQQFSFGTVDRDDAWWTRWSGEPSESAAEKSKR